MTIAMCYVSPEGVVLGADSTASLPTRQGPFTTGFHFFNHNQKLFEVGEDATLGILTWGMGSLGKVSYRTLFAHFAKEMGETPCQSVLEVCEKWRDKFWSSYSSDQTISPIISYCSGLLKKSPFDASAPQNPNMRNPAEENALLQAREMFAVGFCIGGHLECSREPSAYFMEISPLSMGAQINIEPVEMCSYKFWGVPNMIQRLIYGADDRLKNDIIQSQKWKGTDAELDNIFTNQKLLHAMLPIRDAIDFVYTCIHSTIKAMKFSNNPQVCGGPIEIAVITTDRKFRWVRHKEWDAAITDGDPR